MKRVILALGFTTLAVGGSAQAVVLSPGINPIHGTTVDEKPQLAGLVLEDDSVAFSFAAYGGTVSGSVQSRVVRSSVDGTLDFYWRVFNDETSAGDITSFRLANFVTSVYDADYRTDGLGDTAPDGVLKFAEPGLNFLFGNAGGSRLAPGGSSYFLLLDTDATDYARTALYDFTTLENGSISSAYSTFAPAAVVPEPATYALLAGGMGILALARRRRR